MTILETAPIMEYAHAYLWMIIIGGVGTILSFVVGINMDSFISNIAFVLACIFLIVFIVGTILDACEPKIDTGRVQYTIRLDDTVSVNEFYEKYKVLEHTKYTDVYVVEEITND